MSSTSLTSGLTRPQHMLAVLQSHLPQIRDRLNRENSDHGLQQLEGLVMRSGLLQTVLYLYRKHDGADGKGKEEESSLTPLELISLVLEELWQTEPAGSSELFKPVPKRSLPCLNPLVLGRVDRLTYQRLTADVLQLSELITGFAAALAALEPAQGANPTQEGPNT
ncbi:MAG: hypothetical protein KKC99_09725 [Proteobacteria bacterium]|nr:hypothetical protein [Pseudomonadota bacterium]